MTTLEHAATWCAVQGEDESAFAMIAAVWADDPDWAESAGWRRVLDRARLDAADEKGTAIVTADGTVYLPAS